MKENNNEEKAYRSVEKKAIIYPDGRHEVKIALNIKDKKAAATIETIIDEIKDLHKTKKISELIKLQYYHRGIVTGLWAMDAIDELQAEELIQLIDIATNQHIVRIRSN